ncbi:MAG: type II secretion system F family protein [Candidatus Abyssobacteria bacterium SURF_5]|uniref:Type II secretion system F family protein n=1 Tax=Abyssobacteria bacterium (strain SURF_5) TaxID=2093360 RepID=A0A3A4NSG9_ABYX5|nr:MAG: type II secretion system F family protein [Candidatus Abyssubacteria bacterium SURF_5]
MTSTKDAPVSKKTQLFAGSGRIKLKSLANFSKQAAISIRAGLTLTRALPLLARESKDRRLKNAINGVQADIMQGSTLREALQRRASMFPPMFIEMVGAGERSGHLEEVFSRLASYFDMRLKLRRAVVRASIYPAIQLTMAYAVLCLILILFSSSRWATAMTIATYTVASAVCLGAAYYFFARTRLGRAVWDRVLLSLPLLRSITLKLCMARFSRSLAMQIESAIPMTEAIERAALVTGNGAVAASLSRISLPVRQGASLAEAIQSSRLVTPMVREVLTIGEETGSFTESLERVAGIYEEDSMVFLESIPKFIAPIVAIIVGIVVVYLYYQVYFVHYLKPLLESVGI